MKIKKYFYLFVALVLLSNSEVQAQKLWNQLTKVEYAKSDAEVYNKKNFPKDYKLVSLNLEAFKNTLQSKGNKSANIIELPDANGNLRKFSIKEDSNFEIELQQEFPNIKSYSAQGIDDPTAIAKISIGSDGLHGVIFSGQEATVYIDPYSKDNKDYIVYSRNSLSNDNRDFKCLVEQSAKSELLPALQNKNANDGKLRTYRLALVCSGEYSQFHLTRQGVSSIASEAVKKAAVLSAMNTSMTRINGVFEKDLGVKMVIVGNNANVIFLDANSDNITDGNAGTMINEVQTICDAQIGNANYDIGHIFSIGGDGLAGLGVVCRSGEKARGVTGIGSPVNDPYDIDYVAHEIGHQFGATHTQNNNCNRTNLTAVEPGSGSTIMGYAGICSPNVIGTGPSTGNSDDHFHAVSIAQMWAIIQTSANCAATTNTNNTAPTANAGADFTIPKSTPFKLTGVSNDLDGMSSLTYNWEQLDTEIGTMPPLATNAVGPMFQSLPSKTSPIRYMPDLATVLSGNGSTGSEWERIPSVVRDLNFSFLVRDNNVGGGSTARDDMKVSISDSTPFMVTSQNSKVVWDTGSTQTITWEKGSTNLAPINCASVNIKLSTDGGLTYPITLKSNIPNDGSEDIVVPDNATGTARIIVEAADNIFYNINAVNFTINSTTPTFILSESNGVKAVCNTGNATVNYTVNLDFVNGFNETASFTATGQPTGSTVVFSPTSLNADGDVSITVSNLDGKPAQDYAIIMEAKSASVTRNITLALKLTSSTFQPLRLTSPTNGKRSVALSEVLMWDADANAISYDVQIATDTNFTDIVSSGNVTTNQYTSTNLNGKTIYYWRVKPKNNCGEGSFSNAFSFTTIEASYCASTWANTNANEKEFITNVTFNAINNDSGNNISGGYEDFTSVSTNVKRGDSHQISVTMNTAGFQDHCWVFIDWNQDFIFDLTTERYDLGTVLDDIGTATFDINIPNDARFGSTRMRVIIEYDDPTTGFGEGPCLEDHLSEYGETEDYTVIVDNTASVDDASFSNFNLFPNPSNGAFTLNFNMENAENVKLQLFDVRGRLVEEKNYENTSSYFTRKVIFDRASAGLYLLRISNGAKQTTRKLVIK
ncbi:MAG: reprolysin-like metallopeptidase [Polaribacter sp.]|uniref:reprolysin-like metallopeptidase n=1 Tax=Polaribacter sp. TaxID=1920175 RepID=UPI003BAE8A6B